NIEEVGNQGEVSIFSPAREGLDKALAWIKGIVSMPEVGEVYESTVKSVMPYGAFVEFMPGKQGLLHISEVSWKRLETMEGVLSEGDTIKVKLIGVDQKTGKFKLSRKVLMAKPEFKKSENNGGNTN
ncbi:MAG TPA: S1 RNA-binding domain-containing protein, partial [Flavitalea sp.]|nr:S1 RNA-binding domain-containing protein [Flavitalea sp.]